MDEFAQPDLPIVLPLAPQRIIPTLPFDAEILAGKLAEALREGRANERLMLAWLDAQKASAQD